MRWFSSLAIGVGGALAACQASAQPSTGSIFTTAADVQALIAKAAAQTDKPAVLQDILNLPPYTAHLEYRMASTPARVHEREAELFYVIDGGGMVVTGGTLTDSKRTDADNLSGAGISGGRHTHVAKGDFFIVPEGVPHQILPDGGAVVLMSFHVPRAAVKQ